MSPIKMADDEFNNQDFIVEGNQDQKKETEARKNSPGMHMFTSQTSDVGSPHRRMDSGSIDKNMKKMMETMQTKIMKLETENRKLKKEVGDLTNQNKKYQTQVSSFISEQENFAKVRKWNISVLIPWVKIRETYEKRIKRLQEHCKNSDESMTALKRILSLQEEELVERLGKKEVNNNTLSPGQNLQ